ncbi:MAG: BACON domain-containing carbohydrate-binding protein, partial [Verrucomicrobiota bacterium]
DAGWITSISPLSGSGNAAIGFSILANTNPLSRMGSIRILSADSAVQQILTVTQSGAAGYFLSSTNASFTSSAGSSNVQLTASASWIVQTDVDWISGLLPVSGPGNATINYSVAVNNSCSSRSGLIKVFDANQLLKRTMLVTQAGMPGNYSLSSSYLLFPSSGGRVSVNLTARCNWTAVSDVPWINAIIPSSGSTNATIAYTVNSNIATDGRTGYLMILDGNGVVQQSLRIVQTGVVPVYWVSPTSSTFPASGGSSNVSLTANSTWVAQADVSWISGINPSSGSGNSFIEYTVGPNTNNSTRSGTIKILDATLTVQDTLTIIQAGTGISAPLKYAPAPGSTLWSSTLGGTNDDLARAVAVDAEGSVLAAGSIGGSVYLEKISAAGKSIWSKWLSGTGQAKAVALDEAGNIYLGGSFSGTVDFDSVLLSASGVADGFVSKYSADGVQLWARSFGGVGDDSVNSIALHEDTIGLVGVFTSSINFGDSAENSLTASGAKDIFVAKLSSANGQHVWSQQFGSTADDEVKSMAIDLLGNIAISGEFHGGIDFGGGLLSGEDVNGFAAMFSKAGLPIWSNQLNNSGNGLAIDNQGNVFITGSSVDNVRGGKSSYLAKFTGAMSLQPGSYLWSKQIDAPSSLAESVTVDNKGNVSVSGSHLKVADSLNQIETNSALTDIFVTKFSSEGTQLWSKSFGSSGSANSFGLCHDASDNVIIAGTFSGSTDFGGGKQTSSGESDFLVLKLTP